MMGARRRYRSSVALPMSAAALSAPPPSPEEELDRKRKRREERLKQRIKEAKAAKKA